MSAEREAWVEYKGSTEGTPLMTGELSFGKVFPWSTVQGVSGCVVLWSFKRRGLLRLLLH
jgi:hypothetical protein